MKRRFVLVALFTALIARQASASPLLLQYSGTFSAGTTVGFTLLLAPTPFTFEALFDSTADAEPANDAGLFDTVVTFYVPSVGTFTTDPAADVNVILGSQGGIYSAGLTNSSGFSAFFGFFSVATPPFDADAPVPSVLSGFLAFDPHFPWVIPLAGGAGFLNIVTAGLVDFGRTAEITTVPTANPVPEPTSLLLFGSGALGVLAKLRRRKQR